MASLAESIHTLEPEAVYQALGSSPAGLAESEARRRLAEYGPNGIPGPRGRPLVLKFLANFTHVMALLLWAGGIVGLIAGLPQLAIAIWMVNVINGSFSFWQEYRAEKATEALRRLLPAYARVMRDGAEQRLLAQELVPGDVLLLGEGDHISADARLVEVAELRVDESTLTGESKPRSKAARPLSGVGRTVVLDQPNLVFAGTSVTSGTGRAVIYATGLQTEFGKIAHLTQTVAEEASPLQREMVRVTRVVTIMATGIGLLFFALGVALAGVTLYEGFIFAMGMIVAFVPEGLLPTVTLALAMGVQRMAARNALIKKLSAVETLGSTTVICTDKTGVLTKNEMTVRDMWLPGHRLMIRGAGYAPEGEILYEGQPLSKPVGGDLRTMLVAASLCNDARLVPPNGQTPHWAVLGDPTEAALRVVALDGGLDPDRESLRAPRVRELPFDSRRKRMSTIHQLDGARVAYVKGAPKEVLELCSRVRIEGVDQTLSVEERAEIVAVNDEYARGALRVLAIAERLLPDDLLDLTTESVERDLTFLGLMAMMDPPRPDVLDAVDKCTRASIRVVMITGDYGLTAETIARASGITRGPHPRIITGAELAAMDESQLERALTDELIFARVAPEDKLRVVSALQRLGEIVAVTGDGVNDAPALKKADIGVAMGISGTDVARESADMILADDNFASIVNAVEEGRAVYDNIRRFALYVLTSNVPEAVPFIALLFSRGLIPLPLTVMQVLSVDLGTDMVPAVGLGSEPPEAGIMERRPRSQREPLLNGQLLLRVLWFGLLESVAAMSAYFFLNWTHGWPAVPLAAEGTLFYGMATTMTLAGIVAAQIGAVLGYRTDQASIFSIGFLSNRLVLAGIGVEVCLLMLLSYAPPLQGVFNTAPLAPIDWLYAFAWAPIMLAAQEIRKLIVRGRKSSPAVPTPALVPRSG